MKKNDLIGTCIAVGILTCLAIVLSFFLSVGESFRLIFGSAAILFLPGFVWSWIFWKRGEIEAIERGTLSVALSFALVPLITYLLFKAGIKITLFNVIVEISGLIALGIGFNFFLNKKKSARKQMHS